MFGNNVLQWLLMGCECALMYDVGELHGLVKMMNVECNGYGFDLQEEDVDADEVQTVTNSLAAFWNFY